MFEVVSLDALAVRLALCGALAVTTGSWVGWTILAAFETVWAFGAP